MALDEQFARLRTALVFYAAICFMYIVLFFGAPASAVAQQLELGWGFGEVISADESGTSTVASYGV